MLPGYVKRTEKDIKALFVGKGLSNVDNKNIKIAIKITDSPRRKYSIFIDATVLPNTYNGTESDYWITKQDWDECGPEVLKKCKNLVYSF